MRIRSFFAPQSSGSGLSTLYRAARRDDADRVRAPVSGDGGSAVRPGFARDDVTIQSNDSANENAGIVSGGGSGASGSGRADGGIVGTSVRESSGRGPRFDEPIARNGYAWWYLDALSDDGQHGLSIIGLVGSVFSPFYAQARRNGPADPLAHCSMNVAVYGPKRNAWAFTEHGEMDVRRQRTALVIGDSSMEWENDILTVHFEEETAPLPGRISGVVRIHPLTLSADKPFVLDTHGRHRWGPIAPIARAEVELYRPGNVRWKGLAYVDTNAGSEPLEDGFSRWNWCRTTTKERMIVTYDALRRDRSRRTIQHVFHADGRTEPIAPLVERSLDRTKWGLSRDMRVDPHTQARLVRTLEDTPFYSRSEVLGSYLGEYAHGVHESLSLDRWKSRIVQFMLPYRMRRANPRT